MMNDDLDEIYMSSGYEAYKEALAQNEDEERSNKHVIYVADTISDYLSDMFFDLKQENMKAANEDRAKLDDVDFGEDEYNSYKPTERLDDLADYVLTDDNMKDFKEDVLALNRLYNKYMETNDPTIFLKLE